MTAMASGRSIHLIDFTKETVTPIGQGNPPRWPPEE
jgi:hypothetical protein